MNRLKVKKKIDRTIITYKVNKNEQINTIELDIVCNGEIPTLIPIEVCSSLTGNKIRFTIPSCIELVTYFQKGLSIHEFLNIILKIVKTVQKCESYGIRISNLEMNPEHIYYDYNKKEVKMLYWPLISIVEHTNIQDFFKAMGQMIKCNPVEQPYKEGYLAYFDSRMKFNLYHFEKTISSWINQWNIKNQQERHSRGQTLSIEYDDATIRSDKIQSNYSYTATLQRSVLLHLSKNKKIELTKYPFIIGRSEEECDYSTANNYSVSKQHLIIKNIGGKMYLYDNNSTNGVFVNGVEIPQGVNIKVQGKCQIEIGTEKFMLFPIVT